MVLNPEAFDPTTETHLEYSMNRNEVNGNVLDPDMKLPDRLAETFVGKRVLVTGGTGFIGKVLIEKLLRVCPDIGGIIMIVRPKKGKEPKQRVEDIFNNPLFAPLISIRGLDKLLTKVTAVAGDMYEKDIGLSETDRAVCRTANIIVHSAATVRFDESMKSAVTLNTRGTKYMLLLSKECPNLELFIHVSTAYCHPEEKVLEEKLYKPPNDPNEVLQMIEVLKDEDFEALSPKLLGDYPNTYAYSKALTEAIVEQFMEEVPAVIIRPSIVIPIYKEPVIGWTDNINGPMGLMIGAGKGVIRTMYGNGDGFADFVPVDCVVNVLIAVTWDYLKNGCKHKVMNLTSSEEVRVTWQEAIDIGRNIVETSVPFDTVLWYPGGSMTRHKWLHKIKAIFVHWIPAILIDTLLYCLGYKPLLLRIHTRISKSIGVLEFYTTNTWEFRSDKLQAMRKKLNGKEKKNYTMDSDELDIYEYFKNGVLAARRYILKEPDENLPKARFRMKILRLVDILVKSLVFVYVMYCLSCRISFS